MKKTLLSTTIFLLFFSKTEACSFYDPDYEYFNLFTQSIIKDKTYLPFLHTLSNRFYGHEHFEIPDENIESWQKYFGNKLNYQETKLLVQKISMGELNQYKKGNSRNPLFVKLVSYSANSEAIDYLIEAKYLEPFMSFSYVENPNSFYQTESEAEKNATQLDYTKTINALHSLYNAAKNPEIKLRYGYQLVRFNHYTRNYEKSVEAFKKYVQPLKIKTAPYFLALDQMAGSQRGLGNGSEANWNFFQVFSHSKSRKESAFISMKLSDSASFENIMKRVETPSEKNMALFLLGYDDFSNPIPMMEKMFEIDPNSEILKVLAARSINELERSYLPIYFNNTKEENNITDKKSTKTLTEEKKNSEISFWQKIKNFFKQIFSSDENSDSKKGTHQEEDLLKNPNRIPKFTKKEYYYGEGKQKDFAADFKNITAKIKEKSNDEFWQITVAYLSFLQKDYETSAATLNQIKTTNPEYLTEISRMKMLNDIVSQPKITSEFEEHLMKSYPDILEVKPNISTEENNWSGNIPSTQEFIRDILANRYFLQGEEGKSFLMNNLVSDLQYNPNSDLVKKVDAFYRKPNKNSLEQKIIARNIDEVGNLDAFFNVIYGDQEMRLANFEKAKEFYSKAKDFNGIPRINVEWIEDSQKLSPHVFARDQYNGFKNISNLIFGHHQFVSYDSPENVTMNAEKFLSDFPFIKEKMNKVELAESLIQLKKIGNGNDQKSSEANQLIGNLLFNTSILGYYREIFVMDINNSNGQKYRFWNTDQPAFQYYFKNFTTTSFVEADNFDLSLNFYKKALQQSKDKEQKARILFQMANAEQGKYYQYEAKNSEEINYDDPNWSQKQDDLEKVMNAKKNQSYRTYFAELKKNYSETETSEKLRGNCSYYDYFMKKN